MSKEEEQKVGSANLSEESDDWDGELERLFQSSNTNQSGLVASHTTSCEPKQVCFLSLPDEVLHHIFRHTQFAVCVCLTAGTCHRFRSLCRSDRIWKVVFNQRWGDVSDCRLREHPLSAGGINGNSASTNRDTQIDGSHSGDYESMCKLWHKIEENWKTGNCSVNSLEGHSGSVSAAQLMGDTLVTSGEDASIKFWDLEELQCMWSEARAHRGPIWDLTVHGSCVTTCASDGLVKVWSCGREDGWDASPLRCVQVLRGHAQCEVWCCDVTDDNVFSGARDCVAKVWDRETGVNYQTLKGHKASVFVIKAAREDETGLVSTAHTLLTGGGGGEAVLWDLRSGLPEVELLGHTQTVFCADVVSSQGTVFTGSGDGTVRKFDLRKGRCTELFQVDGHTDSVWALQYNSLSRRLTTASVDRAVKIWDGFSCNCTASLGCHLEPVMSLTADARRMVSGDSGGWLFVWDFQREGPGAHESDYNALMSHIGPV